jgi:hypothetical protein
LRSGEDIDENCSCPMYLSIVQRLGGLYLYFVAAGAELT